MLYPPPITAAGTTSSRSALRRDDGLVGNHLATVAGVCVGGCATEPCGAGRDRRRRRRSSLSAVATDAHCGARRYDDRRDLGILADANVALLLRFQLASWDRFGRLSCYSTTDRHAMIADASLLRRSQ